jgi:hypothetical protein
LGATIIDWEGKEEKVSEETAKTLMAKENTQKL